MSVFLDYWSDEYKARISNIWYRLNISYVIRGYHVQVYFNIWSTKNPPYASYGNTLYCEVNGTVLVNGYSSVPRNTDDWVSTSREVGGRTFTCYYPVAETEFDLPAGTRQISGNFTNTWGNYNVNYVPAAGTYSCSGYPYWYFNNINAYNPYGQEDYAAAKFDLTVMGSNQTYTDITNEQDCYQVGSYMDITNVRPYHDYYYISGIDGYEEYPLEGRYRTYFSNNDKQVNIYTAFNSYYIDLNARLDGVDKGGLENFGTANVTINGNLVGQNVTDYYVQHPYNYSYAIDNIIAKPGYSYTGLVSGSDPLSGNEIGKGKNIRLNFVTRTPYNLAVSYVSSTNNSITVAASAEGLNISNYTLYYKKVSDTYYSMLNLGTSTTGTITGLDIDESYNIYLSVTNSAGTTTTSENPVTFSTTLPVPTIEIPTISNLQPFSFTITASASVSPSRTLMYSFSIDNGETWTDYQLSNTYDVSNLNEESLYIVKAKVKALHTGTIGEDTEAISSDIEVMTPADQASAYLKIDNQWVKGKTWYKKQNQWVKAKKIYNKIDNVWRINKNDSGEAI